MDVPIIVGNCVGVELLGCNRILLLLCLFFQHIFLHKFHQQYILDYPLKHE